MIARTICESPEYKADLAKHGFGTNSIVSYGGVTYTHDEIAAMTEDSYRRHRGKYAIICGGSKRLEKRNQRKLEKDVKRDVYGSFGITPASVLLAGLMFFLSGPLGLVIAIVSTLFQYFLEKDLEGDRQMLAAMGA